MQVDFVVDAIAHIAFHSPNCLHILLSNCLLGNQNFGIICKGCWQNLSHSGSKISPPHFMNMIDDVPFSMVGYG